MRADAEARWERWREGADDPEFRQRFASSGRLHAQGCCLWTLLLASRGALGGIDVRASLDAAVDRCVILSRCGRGLDERRFWLSCASAADRLGEVGGLTWDASESGAASEWWIALARGDAWAAREAKGLLATSRRDPMDEKWFARPRTTRNVIDALEAGDEKALTRELLVLLREHDESAVPQEDNVVGRLHRTPMAALVSIDAMAFIAEARRRGLRCEVDSPYLPPGFRSEGARPKPRRSHSNGAPRLTEPREFVRHLDSMKQRLDAGWDSDAKHGSSGFTVATELALRRALRACALAGIGPEAAAFARSALADVETSWGRLLADVGASELPRPATWLVVTTTECRIVHAHATDAWPPRVECAFDAASDAAWLKALDALVEGDDDRARVAAHRLAEMPPDGEEVPHSRRYPPRPLAQAILAIVDRDEDALRRALSEHLAWHDAEGSPEPPGSKYAQTPSLFMLSTTAAACLAVASRRGLLVAIEGGYVPNLRG